jgi:bifunctional ADP-heptose synthase (sugar kinase/adenylyltransferase)
MLEVPNRPPWELNRLDIKNRSPLPEELEQQLLEQLPDLFQDVSALVIVDQVSEPESGVITTAVRERLAELGERYRDKLILADSRERIGLFRHVWLKPNQKECRQAVAASGEAAPPLEDCVRELAVRADRPVLCTGGAEGMLLSSPGVPLERIPAYRVTVPIDPVGAGDSTSAGIACARAAGCTPTEAAAFGCLIASITIQQIGTTGTATPEQVRARWREVCDR